MHARSTSPAGRLLERVLDLDFSVKHLRVGWDAVTVEEVAGLKILDQERAKKLTEDQKSEQEKWEMQRRQEEAQRKAGRMG